MTTQTFTVGRRRHPRRGQRDVHRQPLQRGQRDDRRHQGVGTITDDDPRHALDRRRTVTEGDAGTVTATFTVTLTAASGRPSRSTTPPPTARRPRRATTRDDRHADVHSRPDDPDGHRQGQRRPARRANETSSSTSRARRTRRSPTARASARSPTTTRAGALDQQRDGDRRQRGHGRRDLHRHAGPPAARRSPSPLPPPTTPSAPGDYGGEWDAHLRRRRTDEEGHGPGQRRPAGRVQRDLLVDLTGAVNATIADSQGIGTIIDDDVLPTVSIDDVTVTRERRHDVRRLRSASAPPAVRRSPSRPTANDTASRPATTSRWRHRDLRPRPDPKTFTVLVQVTCSDEINETLREPLGRGECHDRRRPGDGTILDDDRPRGLDRRRGGDRGERRQRATFTLGLSAASGQTVSVGYATADDTALAPGDYTGRRHGRTSPPARPVRRSRSWSKVTCWMSPTKLSGEPERRGECHDRRQPGHRHDPRRRRNTAPSLSINDVTVTEGNAGTVTATFTVNLVAPSGWEVTVDFFDFRRHRARAGRLPVRQRNRHVRGRPDLEERDRPRQWRHPLRGGRDLSSSTSRAPSTPCSTTGRAWGRSRTTMPRRRPRHFHRRPLHLHLHRRRPRLRPGRRPTIRRSTNLRRERA